FAYQGGGRGLDEARLQILEQWVQKDLQPDLTLLFDVPLEISRQRLAQNTALDRFELEKQDFFQRVKQAYLNRAAQFPQRMRVIDSGRSIEEIQVELEKIIASL
ncbi:MAG: dTMP kinase, partial [Sulfuricella sp.]|nr:dTMP kinase [Sulfuricella sp.]